MNDPNRYTAMGMAAMLPGLQFAVDLIQQQLDEMRRELANIQNGVPPTKAKAKPDRHSYMKAYWANMTPEQREAEWKRRRAVAKRKQQLAPNHEPPPPAVKLEAPLKPNNPDHPNHEKWLAKRRKAAAKRRAKKWEENSAA